MEVREDPQAEQPLDRMRRLPMSPCDAFDRREVGEPHARIVARTVQHPSGLAGEPARRLGVAPVPLHERNSDQRQRGAALVGDAGPDVG